MEVRFALTAFADQCYTAPKTPNTPTSSAKKRGKFHVVFSEVMSCWYPSAAKSMDEGDGDDDMEATPSKKPKATPKAKLKSAANTAMANGSDTLSGEILHTPGENEYELQNGVNVCFFNKASPAPSSRKRIGSSKLGLNMVVAYGEQLRTIRSSPDA